MYCCYDPARGEKGSNINQNVFGNITSYLFAGFKKKEQERGMLDAAQLSEINIT